MTTSEAAQVSQRVCFLLKLRQDRVTDYLDAHQVVWPEMLAALSAAGWRNYSLFVRPEDGLVVGYLETDDFDAAQERMARTDINARWQAGMAEYFEAGAPDSGIRPLTHYFHLV